MPTSDEPQGDVAEEAAVSQEAAPESASASQDDEIAKAQATALKWQRRADADAKRVKAAQAALEGVQTDAQNREAQANTQLQEAQVQALRYRVAVEYGLPPALASRLMGTTKEEIEADAKSLTEFASKGKPPPPGDGANGQGPKAEQNPNELLRQIVRR